MIIQELRSNEMQWWMNENETLKIFAEDYNDSADLVDKGSISPTFYEQLLHAQIPKAQKRPSS
jgi:hypothetical protein